MKIRTVFILTIVLVAAALIILFLVQQGLKTTSLSEENAPTEETSGMTSPEQTRETAAPKKMIRQGAITIIETPRGEHKTTPSESAKARENEMRRASPPSSSQGSSAQDAASAPAAAMAGITVINKEPTPVEKKEMQSRGIMIY